MTDFDKFIYNTYLRVTRSEAGLPYRYRKDFSSLEEGTVFKIQKLSSFFTQYKHIDVVEFFTAPFKVHPGEKNFFIEFYLTQRAIKTYTLYKDALYEMSPDAPEQLISIAQSLKFIQEFCTKQNIKAKDYIHYTEPNSATLSFILHLKERSVNIYALQGYPDLSQNLSTMDKSWLEFFLGQQFVERLESFKIKYFTSVKAKRLVEVGLKKVSFLVEKSSPST